jgi:hypothetical protein
MALRAFREAFSAGRSVVERPTGRSSPGFGDGKRVFVQYTHFSGGWQLGAG